MRPFTGVSQSTRSPSASTLYSSRRDTLATTRSSAPGAVKEPVSVWVTAVGRWELAMKRRGAGAAGAAGGGTADAAAADTEADMAGGWRGAPGAQTQNEFRFKRKQKRKRTWIQ